MVEGRGESMWNLSEIRLTVECDECCAWTSFGGQSRSECFRTARDMGWVMKSGLDYGVTAGRCLCPDHAKRRRAP